MSTSGSTDFTLNRDEVITLALKKAKAISLGQTPSAELISDAAKNLNMMLKAFQQKGLKTWLRKRVTVFLEKDKREYSLGSTGDHATYSYTRTQIKTAATSGATSIDVDSTSGMSASDNILIEQDDGTLHETTVSSVTDSDTVVIASGITDGCAVDNYVYFYTNKIARPLRIIDALVRDKDGNDRPVDIISQKRYRELSLKTTDGAVTQVHYDPQLTNGKLYVWPETDDVTSQLELIVARPIEDMDGADDDFDVPVEWMEPIVWGLAWRMCPDHGIDVLHKQDLQTTAALMLEQAESFDVEHETSVQFMPESE